MSLLLRLRWSELFERPVVERNRACRPGERQRSTDQGRIRQRLPPPHLISRTIFFAGKRITPHFVVESLLGYAKTFAYGENVALMPAQGFNNQTSFEIADDVL